MVSVPSTCLSHALQPSSAHAPERRSTSLFICQVGRFTARLPIASRFALQMEGLCAAGLAECLLNEPEAFPHFPANYRHFKMLF